MHKDTLIFVIIAALAGFIAGFLLANSLNRSEIASLRAGVAQPAASNANSSQGREEPDLTAGELRSKIAEADKNPNNFGFQKDLGTALYRYAAMKQDDALMAEARRILERANSLNNADFDVLVALGNAHFDIGFAKKDAAEYQKAREIYAHALEIKPGDADVSTDLGLTYFLQEPPAYDKAAAQLQKVSDGNPKHERSLQFLVQVYIKQDRFADAEKALAKLKAINPANTAIAELTTQLAAAKGGATK